MGLAQELNPIVVILLSSGLATTLMGLLKKASKWIAKQDAKTKQLVVVGISLVIVTINHYLGLALPTDVSVWNIDLLNGLLTAVGALGLHNVKSTLTASTTATTTK